MQPHSDRMLLNAATVAVVPQKHGVNVTYLHGGKPQTVEAKGVIMATPKFITVRMVEGMPQKQKDAVAKMRYIPYAVVNLVYDKAVFNGGYDTWCPGAQLHGLHRRRLDSPQPARLQAEIQHPYLLHASAARAARDSSNRRRQRAACSECVGDFKKLLPETNADPIEVQIYRRGHPLYQSLPAITRRYCRRCASPWSGFSSPYRLRRPGVHHAAGNTSRTPCGEGVREDDRGKPGCGLHLGR